MRLTCRYSSPAHTSPPPGFAAQANVGPEVYAQAAADPFAFWAQQAGRLRWDRPWDTVFDDAQWPTARWFGGGRLAQDLTLPRLRETWTDTPQAATEAAAEWVAAKRGRRAVAPGRELAAPTP